MNMMNVMESIKKARTISRKDRVAQGFTTVRGMADRMRALRTKRWVRQAKTNWISEHRREICARLERAIMADRTLRVAIRREVMVGPEYTPPVRVVWGNGQTEITGSQYVKYHWRNCGAMGTVYHCSTRAITVSAAHALAMLVASGHSPAEYLSR